MKKKYILCILMSLIFFSMKAQNPLTPADTEENEKKQKKISKRLQLEKDSTRYLYGPHTTRVIKESFILENNDAEVYIDTSFIDIHRNSFVEKKKFQYQDLSNVNSPVSPIFFELPHEVGFRLGYQSMAPYYPENRENNYFNTQAPLIFWNVLLGIRGRTQLGIGFSQNITPQVNVGIHYDSSQGNILIGQNRTNSRDIGIKMENVRLFQSFISKNKKQKLLVDFHSLSYLHIETGGIKSDSLINKVFIYSNGRDLIDDFFRLPLGGVENKYENVENTLKENYAKIYYEYKLFQTLQLFTQWKYMDKTFHFSNGNTLSDAIKTDLTPPFTQNNTAWHTTNYRGWMGTFGFKGNYKNLYYRGQLETSSHTVEQKERDVLLHYSLIPQLKTNFYLHYSQEKVDMKNSLSWVVGSKDLMMRSRLNFKKWEAHAFLYSYRPTELQRMYYGNYLQWNHSFENTQTWGVSMSKNISFGNTTIQPKISYYSINKWVYFGANIIPKQALQPIDYLQADVSIHSMYPKNIRHELLLRYTPMKEEQALRVPNYFINYKVYFFSKVFNTRWEVAFGIDFHWHSSYYSSMYDPITQQFYLQDITKIRDPNNPTIETVRMKLGNYPLANLFLNFNIGTVYGFFKLTNLFEKMLGEGYFSTRDYMGIPRNIEIGFRWLMFN